MIQLIMGDPKSKKISKVLVTGGAGFIGSHLVDRLLSEDFEVTILDDFSTGRMQNIFHHRDLEEFHPVRGDVRDIGLSKKVVEDVDAVFHEAALHGGRGYIDTHPAECCSNMILDQLAFERQIGLVYKGYALRVLLAFILHIFKKKRVRHIFLEKKKLIHSSETRRLQTKNMGGQSSWVKWR